MCCKDLIAPQSYRDASPAERLRRTNGCGAMGGPDYVPDTMYGLDVSEACRIHDWSYQIGKTLADKDRADLDFHTNLLRIISNHPGNFLIKFLRRRRARTYYLAVKQFGMSAFLSKQE